MSPRTTRSPQLLDVASPDRSHWLELPTRHSSIRVARHSITARLTAWSVPDGVCADAVLLMSELATNAVRHTPSTRILCGIGLVTDRCLRLEVHDHAYAGGKLQPREPGPDDECGRGLLLVEELADAWGADHSALTGGRAMWATLTTSL